MEKQEALELHDLETIEHNLAVGEERESEAGDGFMIASPSGFMIASPSGFMIASPSGFMIA